MQISLEENGIKGLQRALGTIARAKGMTALAKETGLGCQNLYKALSDEANPNFESVNKIIKALGCKLIVVQENQSTL